MGVNRKLIQGDLFLSEAIRFFTDVHIAIEAVRQLQKKGVDIIHCGDVGLSDADDRELLRYATQNGRVMVTCDQGFEGYHTEWLKLEHEHAGIVYFRMLDQCQSISVIVRESLFLWEAADYMTDLYNQIWRAQG
jgi:predicted nuclease of predicted toxin-antitoxin system